jgi:energy-coupling factor transporter ATP-binding protein EcfA2
MISPMVKAQDLSIVSRSGGALLGGFSFSVAPGQIHILSGEAGSGKSICARALCNLLPDNLHAEGQITCENAVYVGEDPDSQIITLTVADEVASALEFSRVPTTEILIRSHEALRLMGLLGLESRNPLTLSGGQRQRLIFASALARQPLVLVLDEPCASIDTAGRELIYRMLREQANQGMTVVLFEKRQELPSWADELTFLPPPSEQPSRHALSPALWHPAPVRQLAPVVKIEKVFLGKKIMRLAGVSLELKPGNIHLITGPNGCGKTSLMSVLAGAVRPNSGTVEVNGKAVRRLPDGLLAWAQQNPERQFVQGTVKEEIAAALKTSELGGPLSTAQLNDLPALFGFADAGTESPYSLSAGKKRRLGVLLALLSNRPLVLLDEPTANLGSLNELNQVLQVYSRNGGTIVASSHDVELLWADRVIEMRAGRIETASDTVAGLTEIRLPPARPACPPLNPVTVIAVLAWLVVLAIIVQDPMIVAALSLACLITATGFHRSWKKFIGHVAIVSLAGLIFFLIALRSNWYGGTGIDWLVVSKHGALGSLLLAASLWAGSLTDGSQLAAAISQRLRVPYTWCTLALSGTSIAVFLQSVAPLVTAAIRLRRIRLDAPVSNLLVYASLPLYSALPLFIESIRHSERLHVTLTSREFGRYPTKTFRVLYPWRARDGGAVALLALLTVAATVLYCVSCFG